jgi:hypothetical protein
MGDSKAQDAELNSVRDTLRRAFYPRLKIVKVVPVWKESGCFVHFTSKGDALAATEEEETLQGLTGRKNRIFIVQGTPFVEDMRDWQPSRIVKIESDNKLTLEELFSELRQFGQLKSLAGSKQEFVARFGDLRAAIAARSCLHGKKRANGVSLNISYNRTLRLADLVKTVYGNTRVLAIVLAVSVAVFTVLVIAPIRSYFVTQTLLVGVRAPSWQVLQELRKTFIWTVTSDQEQQLRALLSQQPTAVTLITGDKAMGKSEVLRKVLHRRLFAVRIDCGNCDSVQDFLLKMEAAIGFTPSFGTLNNLRSYLDAVATLGVKRDGLSDTSASQLRQMLSTLSASLYVLSLRYSANKPAPKPSASAAAAPPPTPPPGTAEQQAPLADAAAPAPASASAPAKAIQAVTDAGKTAISTTIGLAAKSIDLMSGLVPGGQRPAAAPAASVSEAVAPVAVRLPGGVSADDAHVEDAPPTGFFGRVYNWVRGSTLRRNARNEAEKAGGATYAVVVLDNFSELIESMSRQSPAEAKKARELVDMIVQFSSNVTTAGVAHVVLVSHNSFTENMVRSYPALRDCLNTIHVRDPSPAQVEQYLHARLGAHVDAQRLIGVLGCRVSDIEALARRVERLPNASVDAMMTQLVDETTNGVLDRAFGSNLYSFDAPPGATWHPKDVWRVMLQLSQTKERSLHSGHERASLDYQTVLATIFKGNENAVQGLVEAQLLSVWHSESYRDASGVVQPAGSRISAASPLMQTVFEHITRDLPLLRRGLDSMWYMADLATLHKAIAEVEDELLKLQQASYGFTSAEVASAYERARELGERLRVLNGKVELVQKGLRQFNAIKPSYLP